jgi:hypothetical protein
MRVEYHVVLSVNSASCSFESDHMTEVPSCIIICMEAEMMIQTVIYTRSSE